MIVNSDLKQETGCFFWPFFNNNLHYLQNLQSSLTLTKVTWKNIGLEHNLDRITFSLKMYRKNKVGTFFFLMQALLYHCRALQHEWSIWMWRIIWAQLCEWLWVLTSRLSESQLLIFSWCWLSLSLVKIKNVTVGRSYQLSLINVRLILWITWWQAKIKLSCCGVCVLIKITSEGRTSTLLHHFTTVSGLNTSIAILILSSWSCRVIFCSSVLPLQLFFNIISLSLST